MGAGEEGEERRAHSAAVSWYRQFPFRLKAETPASCSRTVSGNLGFYRTEEEFTVNNYT